MSRDKSKTLYLHYQKTYVNKTYQGGDIVWRAPTHIFAWRLNEVVT